MQKSPDAKPEIKLRMVLLDGKSAYVFEFVTPTGRADRDAIIDAHKRAQVGGGASGGFTPSAAPSGSALLRVATPAAATAAGAAAQPADASSSTAAALACKELRRSLLGARPHLRLEYESLVGGGVVTDAEFWARDSHRALLAEALAAASSRVGLSSRAPATLTRASNALTAAGRAAMAGDDPYAAAGGGSGSSLKLDSQTQLAIMRREPALAEAFTAFVSTGDPPRMRLKEFWTAYMRADRERAERRQKLEDGALLGGGGGSYASSSAATAGGTDRPLSDIKAMTPSEFFDALKKGEFPPPYTQSAAAGLGAGGSRKRSAIGRLDPSFDLLASVEDSERARSLRGLPPAPGPGGGGSGSGGAAAASAGRGGYGTGEGARPYDVNPLLEGVVGAGGGTGITGADAAGSSAAVRVVETVRRRERAAEAVIHDVNSYSKQVVDSAEPAAAATAAAGAGRAPRPSPAGSDSSAGARGRHFGAGAGAGGGGPASAADDLPDLYAPPPPSAGVVPLNVDLVALRQSLEAQGEDDEEGDDVGGGVAAVSIGSASAASGGGGWSVVTDAALGRPARPAAAAPESAPPSRKRPRPVDDAPPSATAAATASKPIPLPPRHAKPDALEALAGKPFLGAAKKALRDLAAAGHDLFENAGDRSSRTGMLRTVPKPWQAYVELRARLNREVLASLWPTLTSGRPGDPRVADRRRKLLEAVSNEYATLERLKRDVLSKGAHALLPPAATGAGAAPGSAGQRAVEPEIAVLPATEAAGRAATSDLVALLNMLQAALHPSLQKGEEVQQQLQLALQQQPQQAGR